MYGTTGRGPCLIMARHHGDGRSDGIFKKFKPEVPRYGRLKQN